MDRGRLFYCGTANIQPSAYLVLFEIRVDWHLITGVFLV